MGNIIGTIFTAAVQSSSATAGVVIVLASQGLLSTGAGIAIILGANVGTCVTAVLSALGRPRAAMRVAFSHIFFNVAGVLLWLGFINYLAEVVEMISGGDQARQIANAHTLFNVANTVVFIWFVTPVTKLVMRLLPEVKPKEEKVFPELLHDYYLENPPMALELAGNAIVQMGQSTVDIIENGISVALKGNSKRLNQLRKKDEFIDRGHTEILIFLQQIQSTTIASQESEQLEGQIEAVNILESAADLITTDLVEAAEHRINNELTVSEVTTGKLLKLYDITMDSFKSAIIKFGGDKNNGVPKEATKALFKNEYLEVRTHLMQRLSQTDDKRISIFRFETEVLEISRRLHALSRRLNRKVV